MSVHLTPEDHARVSAAVAAAESRTAGEIVTVVAARSDGYSDIQMAWAALAAFTALTLFALFPELVLGRLQWLHSEWNQAWTEREVLGIAAALAMTTFLAVWLVQLWRPLKFALVPAPIKTDRAIDRAVDLFKVGAERRTHGRTGVLIYLSLHEHRAEIVADEAIASRVGPETWAEAMAAMLAEIKQGRMADGMIAAVERVGAVLAEHFPRADDDTNELPDRLIEL